ncbi:MAG TPA: tetratricopeptide repeat protein [Isosphaeraceae bacterium]|jgi:predicted Zn-dependent protease|nr:tetratricopeptide repeat protein [Isosphaeraceae bacterium]
MTVRWKPLMVLSGLFVVIAVVGLAAIVLAMLPAGRAEDLLPAARAERAAKQYARAEIQYRKALQRDGKDPKVHLELAEMYAEWAEVAPADRLGRLQANRLHALDEAAKYGKQLAEPRRLLLIDALRRNEAAEGLQRAKELSALEPNDPDARYVLAEEALAATPPDVPAARKHLAVLEARKAPAVRVDWIKARIAEASRQAGELDEALARGVATKLADDADPVDRLARLRLEVLAAARATEPAALLELSRAAQAGATSLTDTKDAAPARITQVGLLLGQLQQALTRIAAKAEGSDRAALDAAGEQVERGIVATYQKALDASKTPDLRIYLAFAEHLRVRGEYARAAEVVAQALKSPLAPLPAYLDEAMQLRETAIKAVLAEAKDPGRFDKAAPWIAEMLGSTSTRYQGLGHLFQGTIDLERSGLGGGEKAPRGAAEASAKLRASAVTHLKAAAAAWPELAAAQALYGVALTLNGEPALGRQYLQNARRLPNLDPRHQVWAAWSQLQAGYPEEAEPVVKDLLPRVGRGELPADLGGMLHLLAGEVARAHNDPGLARAEYEKAAAAGQEVPAIRLREAQVSALEKDPSAGLKELNKLRASGQGGPAAEQMAVVALRRAGKDAEARKLLDAARARFPDSDELAAVDAGMLLKAGKADVAERLLADYQARYPDHIGIILVRARFLADQLGKVAEARKLLSVAADRLENSAPLILLAQIELQAKDLDAMARTVARVRARWKEAAAADLLDAQLCMARGDLHGASRRLDAALKKDPGEKVVRYYKGRLAEQAGALAEAARIFEDLERSDTLKELEPGLSLREAAAWARADMDLATLDGDAGIARYRAILASVAEPVARRVRWKLVAALSSKDQWPAAKAELVALLKDPATTADEYVQAANYSIRHKDEAGARVLLDRVLKDDPAHAGAAITRAFLFADANKDDEAIALLRRAIASAKGSPPPAVVYLTLSALVNGRERSTDGLKRAAGVLDEGLKAHPDATELLRARYQVQSLLGDPKTALAAVEARAKEDPKGIIRRVLADLYRERGDLPSAERVVRELVKVEPGDPTLAGTLVRLVASEAVAAGARGDNAARSRRLDDATTLLRTARGKFPDDPGLVEVEFELATVRGDRDRATALVREAEKLGPSSPVAPLLRARLYEGRNPQEVARAYEEALARDPRRGDVRLALAQTDLNLGRLDDAIAQADRILERDAEHGPAALVKARALARLDAPDDPKGAKGDEAIDLLRKAIRRRPDFAEAHHLIAEIEARRGRRAEAVKALREALAAMPGDATALALLVQFLTEPRPDGSKPGAEDIRQAEEIAATKGKEDKRGDLSMGLAVGFHKAGRLDLAEPWAAKAVTSLDTPGAHLNYGDLLLAIGEANPDADSAKATFRKAAEQYEQVLKGEPGSVAAVNNLSWILHSYLGDDRRALKLMDDLMKRVDPAMVPGEVFDTLGAVQEALGQSKAAEQSYALGLRKDPAHPVLNYHMGRLFARDRDRTRARRAGPYLLKAKQSPARLSPEMRAEVDDLLASLQ